MLHKCPFSFFLLFSLPFPNSNNNSNNKNIIIFLNLSCSLSVSWARLPGTWEQQWWFNHLTICQISHRTWCRVRGDACCWVCLLWAVGSGKRNSSFQKQTMSVLHTDGTGMTRSHLFFFLSSYGRPRLPRPGCLHWKLLCSFLCCLNEHSSVPLSHEVLKLL